MSKGLCPLTNKKVDDYRDTIKQMKEHFDEFYDSKTLAKQAYEQYEAFSQSANENDSTNPATFG